MLTTKIDEFSIIQHIKNIILFAYHTVTKILDECECPKIQNCTIQ